MDLVAIWTKYKKIILAVAGSLILLIILAIALSKAESWWSNHKIAQAEANVNAAKQEVANLQTQVANVKELTEANANLKIAENDLTRIQNEVNTASQESNQALSNVNAVNAGNYNGTSPDAANSARCRSFPTSPECVH